MYTTSAKYFLVVLSIICALFTVPAYGVDTSSFCSQKDTAIYHANGVFTDRMGAKRNLIVLENAVISVIPTAEADKIEFRLAYNTTNGHLADLFEAATQSIISDVTSFWVGLAGLIPNQSISDNMIRLSSLVDQAALLANQDLTGHVSDYKNSILEGKKLILVPHSQGNFFANESYNYLSSSEKSSFGIVAVANPDTHVASGGPHTTLFEDLVIDAIILVKQAAHLPIPQLPNVTNYLTFADLTGHGFQQCYLASDSNSRSKILSDILSVKEGLVAPPNNAGQGIITVTLTWGAQPDVDLHAFEPNGTHVYYANRFGPSGYLDVDDVTSYGPEHYFVSCDTLETGTYSFGVNYYHGYAPEVANIVIQAGLNQKSTSVYLPTALYSSGNATPISVGTITVTGNTQDGFNFNIQ